MRSPPTCASFWWVLLLSVVRAQEVDVHNEVTGYLGKEVVLPCKFTPKNDTTKVSQISWVKQEVGKKQNVAVYHPSHGASFPTDKEKKRFRFQSPSLEDATLIIGSLLASDEGNYTCEFTTYPSGKVVGFTQLKVETWSPSPEPSGESTARRNRLSTGVIAGIIVACLVGTVLVIALISYQTLRNAQRKENDPARRMSHHSENGRSSNPSSRASISSQPRQSIQSM